MIPRAYIIEWRETAPWIDDAQVEQDLIIERVLHELYQDSFLSERLGFRGATALHKLYLAPAARYSEDIDLVQLPPEPIKETIQAIQSALDFLGKSSTKQKMHNNVVYFRFDSEIPPIRTMRLKIEINCWEHQPVMGITSVPFTTQSAYYSGSTNLTTYPVEELLATKLRALYQRKKGRDLFDLWYAEQQIQPDLKMIAKVCNSYLELEGNTISRTWYQRNLEAKLKDEDFMNDTTTILRPAITYQPLEAGAFVRESIIRYL